MEVVVLKLNLGVYLVTDRRLCGERGVTNVVREALDGGVTIVQLRDHDATSRELVAQGRALRKINQAAGTVLIIDDRLDVALAVEADGVHLGQSDLHPVDARRIAGPELFIGHSVASVREAEAVAAWPAGTVDYLSIGPLRATPTKPDAASPLGVDGVRRIVTATSLPTVAIGGITADDVAQLWTVGVDGIAVVSAVCAAADPRAAAARLRTAYSEVSNDG